MGAGLSQTGYLYADDDDDDDEEAVVDGDKGANYEKSTAAEAADHGTDSEEEKIM